ncbi:glycosyltransferase [uncultured Fusobacterium sp.]|uniref:glycosyltransferase n=1 Tax=uncultured Fusobacterium sp. TaxID=159267 RepID=UPI0025EDE65C|nr:glycosyltransferase [uncultured Fusobacterium sp.]
MKISVIVPVYNRLEHLRALCLCLIKQEEKPDELIISDDGSSEKVMDFIEDLFPKMDFKVKHIYQKDLGFRKTRALNNGVREAEGDVLVFCDQDLIFPESHIKNIKKEIKRGIFLMGRPYSTNENEKNTIVFNLEKNKSYMESIDIIPKEYVISVRKTLKKDKNRRILNKIGLNKRGIKLVGMSYAMYKEDYIAVNGYDEKYMGWGFEDDDFGNRLMVFGVKGKEFDYEPIQLHLYHPYDSTKKQSANEKYYYEQKEKILKNKQFYCEYGYNNSLMKDRIEIKILINEKGKENEKNIGNNTSL